MTPVTDEEIARERRRLVGECVAHLRRAMREQGVNQRELARRLGTSPARVSTVLKGERNLTLKTIATFAAALDHYFDLRVKEPPRPLQPDDMSFLCLGA